MADGLAGVSEAGQFAHLFHFAGAASVHAVAPMAWSAQRLCTGGRKWPVSRLAGRGIRPIPRGALPRAYATGYAGFGVHVRVCLCLISAAASSEELAAGG